MSETSKSGGENRYETQSVPGKAEPVPAESAESAGPVSAEFPEQKERPAAGLRLSKN